MGLTTLYRDTHVLEAAINYTKADDPLNAPDVATDPASDELEYIYYDEGFWGYVFSESERLWDKNFQTTSRMTLSEWIPRVPGLYWHPGSKPFQEFKDIELQKIHGNIPAYAPPSKSSIVMGGTGTLKLPPDNQGRRLVSLSQAKNASVGIPVLIYPEVWEHHKLKEGSQIQGVFRWKKMEQQWAQYFMRQKNIVRGYLEIRHPDQISVEGEDLIVVHPYSILEYEKEGKRYYDFMFFTMHHTTDRTALNAFLKNYAAHQGNGRYLLECDVSQPLFDGQYSDPADFRANGQEHLEFMERRMNDTLQGSSLQDQVYSALGQHYFSNADLVRVSTLIQISPALWNVDGQAVDNIVSFLNEVNQKKAMHQLIDIIQHEHPNVLQP